MRGKLNLPMLLFKVGLLALIKMDSFILYQDLINRMRNLHQIILEGNGMEALQLFRERERLQLRDCDYKNHCDWFGWPVWLLW